MIRGTFALVSSEPSHKPEAQGASAVAPSNDEAVEPDKARALEPTAAVTPSDPGAWSGRVLDDRYRILRLLGEGGMGAVFVAEHLTLHKQVALKVVRAELAGNGEVAARFAREAMATAQFEHPHVASAIDYGTLPEGGAYFVMQLVRGRSLRALLAANKQLQWRRVCELAAQVADALSAAKAAGIIHRDLKPDNVLVERREDGSDLVKVLDFGIAHIAPRDSVAPPGAAGAHRELTRVGTVMGTPGYMAPEQAVGDKVDHRADLYALGVVIWEAIAGRELWDGPDLTTVVTRQMSEPVPRLRELGIDPLLPAALDELIQRLTALAVGQRPEHAAEVRDELRRLAQTSAPRWVLPAGLSAIATPIVSRARPTVTRALSAYRAQPKTVRRALVGAALFVVLVPLALLPAEQQAPDVKMAITPAAGTTEPGPPASLKAAPVAPAPSVIERVVRAASNAVGKTQAPAIKPVAVLPVELAEPAQTVIDGKTLRERRAAAAKLLAYKPADRVYPYLRTIAELESARSCRARKVLLAKMGKERDDHYLPTLRRLNRTSRSGCGFLSLSDCLSCIRDDLRDALDAIERVDTQAIPKGSKPTSPP